MQTESRHEPAKRVPALVEEYVPGSVMMYVAPFAVTGSRVRSARVCDPRVRGLTRGYMPSPAPRVLLQLVTKASRFRFEAIAGAIHFHAPVHRR